MCVKYVILCVIELQPICCSSKTVLSCFALTPICRYEEAHDLLQVMVKNAKSNADRKEFTTKAKKAFQLFNEQAEGLYDIDPLYTQGAEAEVHGIAAKLDVADYVGPVRVALVPDKGRGLVATRDIAPGELVMAIKAEDIVGGAEVRPLSCMRDLILICSSPTIQHRHWAPL
jgi:hypothetical protein